MVEHLCYAVYLEQLILIGIVPLLCTSPTHHHNISVHVVSFHDDRRVQSVRSIIVGTHNT